jgi:predicted ester cyclase
MSVDEPKAINRRLVESLLHGSQLELVGDLVAEDVVDHFVLPSQAEGRDGVVDMIQTVKRAFPDVRLETIVELQEGDLHATIERFTGTQRGEFLGVPPTNREVSILIARFSRMREGKCVEQWRFADTRSLQLQLGLTPPAF